MRGMLLIPLMSVTSPSHIPLTSIVHLKERERSIYGKRIRSDALQAISPSIYQATRLCIP